MKCSLNEREAMLELGGRKFGEKLSFVSDRNVAGFFRNDDSDGISLLRDAEGRAVT